MILCLQHNSLAPGHFDPVISLSPHSHLRVKSVSYKVLNVTNYQMLQSTKCYQVENITKYLMLKSIKY